MKTNIFLLIIRLQKTSWRRLEDVLVKTSIIVLSIRLQDVFQMFSRHLQDVLKDDLQKRLQDVFKKSSRRFQDVFKTSSRRLANTSWRHLQDALKTYHRVKLFLLTSLWEVFKMFLRRTAKTAVYRRIDRGHTSEKFMVSVQNLKVLVFQFTTPFSGCL